MKTIKRNREISFQVAETSGQLLEAKKLCHNVYLEAKFIKKPLAGGVIPHKHDTNSIYFIAVTDDNEVVGTLRMTVGHYKTLDAWKGQLYSSKKEILETVKGSNSFELGALAVRKDYRSKKVSWGMYKAALKYSLTLNMEYAIIGMDVGSLKSLEDLGYFVIRIGEPKEYFGSMTVPGILPIKQQTIKVARNNHSYYSYLVA
jgi:N-acyl-L-homoserine lactone synthetase